jgi:hypothetical protein
MDIMPLQAHHQILQHLALLAPSERISHQLVVVIFPRSGDLPEKTYLIDFTRRSQVTNGGLQNAHRCPCCSS